MASPPFVVLAGAAISLLGNVQYIRDTLQGVTKPNRVSWLLWSVAPLIGVAAALSDGVQWSLLPVFMAGFCPLLILIASFHNTKAYWELDRFDYACAILSAAALVFWAYAKFWARAHEPARVIFLAIAADACAAIPVIRKSWYRPDTETASTFATATFSAITSFFAIVEWKFTEWAFPAYLTVWGTCLCLIILVRRRFPPSPAMPERP